MRIEIILFLLCLLSCDNPKKRSNIIFPPGGYDFITPGTDTFFANYPMKKVIPRGDSNRIAWQSYYYFKGFDETNISLRPASEPTFKFQYEARDKLYIITLNPELITIKKWVRGLIFPDEENKGLMKVSYETKKISITLTEFEKLVNSINSSGYWQMPYERHCNNLSHDAPGFSLEANTGQKYNFVRSFTCPDQAGTFDKACFDIIKKCNLQDKISLGIQ